jgi:hypothetical protein
VSELFAYAELGLRHILDPRGLDHVLFLLVLAAIYRASEWRRQVWVATAFTAGHSVTLALTVTGVLAIPAAAVEFLIPVTIVATAAENLLVRDRERAPWGGRYRPVFAGVFGLVHGAGFASYLRSLFLDDVAVPLLGFNLGIEAAQLAVLVVAGAALAAADRGLAALRLPARAPSPLRLRVVAVSLAVGAVAFAWAVERAPW